MLGIKVRDGGRVVNKSAYLAIGVDMDGVKHILGIWLAKEKGASFWAHVCANLASRGVQDVFIVCCDGLKGLPEAVEATWPGSMVQTCVVYLIRAANRWVAYGDRKAVSAALKRSTPHWMRPPHARRWMISPNPNWARNIRNP